MEGEKKGKLQIVKGFGPFSNFHKVSLVQKNEQSFIYRYDVPVIIFHSTCNSTHGTILISDLTKIDQKTCYRFHCSPWNSNLPTCELDSTTIFPNELFTTNVVDKEWQKEALEQFSNDENVDNKIGIARLKFDLRARNIKFLEGLAFDCKLVDSNNIYEVMKGIENDCVNLLERLQSKVSETYWTELSTKLNLQNFINEKGVSMREILDTQSSLYKESQSFDVSNNDTVLPTQVTNGSIIQGRTSTAQNGISKKRKLLNNQQLPQIPQENEDTSDFEGNDQFIVNSSQIKKKKFTDLLNTSTTISQDIRHERNSLNLATPPKSSPLRSSQSNISFSPTSKSTSAQVQSKLEFKSIKELKEYYQDHRQVNESQVIVLKAILRVEMKPKKAKIYEPIERTVKFFQFKIHLIDTQGHVLVIEFDNIKDQFKFSNVYRNREESLILDDCYDNVLSTLENKFKGGFTKREVLIRRKFRLSSGGIKDVFYAFESLNTSPGYKYD
ncbi:hypothetical protein KGF54_000480 [Candida jiufengensis]|uniref:uncharacterized protein n=1 Tax=Candida jiufengensis TaxID=497108 RepID=UPI0022240546|nr:uncharacterized protein KGF54_000480 [Candida jiufengensis]KAI5956862.1 hypothetical protein KGF54_000480 [Candida jiufengensis]